ncbi:MAG: tetratricopeptide repeat protein [Bacteroidota bacterium]
MGKDKTKYLNAGLIILMILIAGCSMWESFTTYYNRFYNAEKAFDTAMEEIELNQQRKLFDFREDKIPSSANKDFDIVIKNCSKILQFNKESNYLNESIFMLGQAFYYKGQYNKSLRKFQELDGLNDEDFMLENRLWIAKSEMQMRNFSLGLNHLEEVKTNAKAAEEEEIVFEAYRTHISYLIYKENYSKTVQIINELLHEQLTDEALAEVTYELGLLYVSLEHYEEAVSAFEQVEEGSPTFDIEFKSKLEYAKAIKHLEREDEALELFEDLKDNSKYKDFWDMVELEIAQIKLDRGEIELALELFTAVDTAYKKTESAGIAAFMRGDIVEHDYMDFDSAKILYDRINSTSAPEEFKVEARNKSNSLKLRKDYSDKIIVSKKEEFYLIDTLLFRKDSLAYAEYETRRDSAEQVDKRIRASMGAADRAARGTSSRAQKYKFIYEEDSLFIYKPKMPKITLDSMRTFIARNEYELGNLYFADLDVPDSAFYYYTNVLENYSNTDFQAKTMYALGSYYLTLDEKEKADSLFREVYDNYKEDSIAKAAAVRLGIDAAILDKDPAKKKYLDGESNLEKENYFDAIDQFFSIYEEFPQSQYAPKSLYTIGWIYENKLLDNGFAADYYDTLQTHYPKTEYAKSVSKKLRFYKQRMKTIEDSIAQVQKAIEDSLKLIAQQDSLAQLDSLKLEGVLSDSVSVQDTSNIVSEDTTSNVISDQLQEELPDSIKENEQNQQIEDPQ